MIKLLKGDCLIENEKIESGSVDLILTDLPYGNMNTDGGRKLGINGWDLAIDPKKVFDIANRILRKNGKMILFSQEPYTTKLITEAIPNTPFSYRATWEKDNFANALGTKVNMVSFTEDVLVFSKRNAKNDIDSENEIRDYFLNERKKTELSYKQINEDCFNSASNGGGMASNILTSYKKGWTFPTKEKYEALQKIGICLKPYEELKKESDLLRDKYINNESLKYPSTFNLWEGNKFKSNILKYKKDYTGHHPTQKPVLLLEDLIKTFSNEGDNVVDLTMGSGSTGVACVNTSRNFIGIEMDEGYFNIAEERVNCS
tara:strand:- start:17471 stop:18418 length:948 start_codon:yes stop_codon:yes gene_type:complete